MSSFTMGIGASSALVADGNATNYTAPPAAPPSPPVAKTEEELAAEAEAERAAAEEAVNEATSALGEVSNVLDALNDDNNGTQAAITLKAEDCATFFDLIDATVNLAISSGLTETAKGGADDEAIEASVNATADGKGQQAGEEASESEDSSAANAAADAVSAVVDGLSVALARGLAEGESVAIESETMVLVVEKVTIPSFSVRDILGNSTDIDGTEGASGEALSEEEAIEAASLAFLDSQLAALNKSASTSKPSLLLAPSTPNVQASFADFAKARPEGSAPVFLVPPSLDALKGAGSVDVQVVEFKSSTRSPPPPSGNTVVDFSSSITSMSIRVGSSTVKVENSTQPVLISTTVALPTRRRLQEVHDCRAELEAVDACVRSLEAWLSLVEEQKLECDRAVANARLAQQVFPECLVVPQLIGNYTAEAEGCARLPIPCSGRGTCDGETGRCKHAALVLKP